MEPLNLAQLEECYLSEGFLHLPGFFSAAQISRFIEVADKVLLAEKDRGVVHAYDQTFSQVKMPWTKDAVLNELTTDRRLGELVRALSGFPSISVFLDRILYKYPGAGPTKPHIDAHFLSFDDPRALACWVALNDTTEANGALAYYMTSHDRRAGAAGDHLPTNDRLMPASLKETGRLRLPCFERPRVAGCLC